MELLQKKLSILQEHQKIHKLTMLKNELLKNQRLDKESC